MKAVDAATMRSLDRRAIEDAGIPGELLMERAGEGLAFECELFAKSLPPRHSRRFVVLAGKGNNGGDAFVAARILSERMPQMEISLHCSCPPEALSGDAAKMFERLPLKLKSSFSLNLKPCDLGEGGIVIDGLLGTGFSGSLRSPFQEWIDAVNASGLPVVSIDIPSGLNADDGSVASRAIEADLTVTMALPKNGLLLGEGPRLSGRLRVVDLGFPKEFAASAPSSLELTLTSDLRAFFGREPFDIHKNLRGHVLVVGGSRLYPGAPALTVFATLKSGAGLATLAVPEEASPHGAVPNSAILRKIPTAGKGFFCEVSLPSLRELAEKASAIALGPGLSTELGCACVVRAVVEAGKPLALDADALNLIAANPSLLDGLSAPCVLTPHPGEMKRLAEGFGIDASLDRAGLAKALAAKTRACVILKGARSVVASPSGRVAFNGSGCPSLAVAGSGDSLTGLCAALLARGFDAFDAARCAAFLHGLAGELARPCGSRGLCADELPCFIEQALKELSPLA